MWFPSISFRSWKQSITHFHIWDQPHSHYTRVIRCTRHVKGYEAMWHYLSNYTMHYKHPTAVNCSCKQPRLCRSDVEKQKPADNQQNTIVFIYFNNRNL